MSSCSGCFPGAGQNDKALELVVAARASVEGDEDLDRADQLLAETMKKVVGAVG